MICLMSFQIRQLTVDMFRRKTINLSYDRMILFDYISGNIVSCNFSNEFGDDTVESEVYPDMLKSMNITSLHNHPKQFFFTTLW